MYRIERTESAINDLMNKAMRSFDEGSTYPGMSYEQGIVDAILWLTGQSNDNPLEDE